MIELINDWFAALRSGWKAGLKQYRKRFTELQKVAS